MVWNCALGSPLVKMSACCSLVLNVLGNDALVLANLSSEEMVLQGQIFVARGHLGDIDQRKTSLVVLKDRGSDRALLDKVKP